VIRVLLVDDQPLIRGGFRALLDAEDDIEVVAEAADGKAGVALALEHTPDVALVDIQMPGVDGIDATRRIVADERLADVHVVILTNYGIDEHVYSALRAGASGFLVKDIEPADLIQAIHEVSRGALYLSSGVSRELLQAYLENEASRVNPLSGREREVLQLIAEGKTTKEIAAILGVSPKTVETHRMRLMDKLDIHETAGLVRYAIRRGVIQP